MIDNDLDHLTLSSYQRQLLYSEGITNIDFNENAVNEPTPIIFSGKNLKNILVGIDLPGNLGKSDQELLENLLKACKLNMNDVALVNLSEQNVAFSEILDRFEIKNVLLFGVSVKATRIELIDSEEKLMTLANRVFLRTASLSRLQNDVGKKKKLWIALKEMFDL